MTKILFTISALIIGLTFTGIETNAQEVSGSIGNGTVRRGAVARGTIVLEIPKELHVNSNKPNTEYAIPTTVRITGNGLRVGAITFPRGKNLKFQFSEDFINVYEGTVFFPFKITVPRNFRGNSIKLKAVVRYQACTNEVCYPPRSKTVDLTARVR
ncbi:MAG: protein-disulfide reductase DsbD N-terminal domain-containing protein [Pyrinomonadaceae bacterium]